MIDKQGDQVHSINAEVQEVERLPDEWLALSKAEKQRVLTILKGLLHAKVPKLHLGLRRKRSSTDP